MSVDVIVIAHVIVDVLVNVNARVIVIERRRAVASRQAGVRPHVLRGPSEQATCG